MQLPNEIWKNIPNYEGYQVSNLGRIKSLKTNIIRKIQINRRGYQHVKLNKNGQYKLLRVHRLVAQAFIPNPHNYEDVDHIDENQQNNNVNNLRWCTHSQNLIFCNQHHPHMQQSKRKPLVAKNNDISIFFPSITIASKYVSSHITHHTYGAAMSSIYQALNKSKTHQMYNFTWNYV